VWLDKLDHRDVIGSRTLGTFNDVEGHLVAFTEGFEAGCVDCRVVHKHIRAVFLLNETEAFLVIEPLYGTIAHRAILLSLKFSTSQTGGGKAGWIFFSFRDKLPGWMKGGFD
jgi:hypothetical protein